MLADPVLTRQHFVKICEATCRVAVRLNRRDEFRGGCLGATQPQDRPTISHARLTSPSTLIILVIVKYLYIEFNKESAILTI